MYPSTIQYFEKRSLYGSVHKMLIHRSPQNRLGEVAFCNPFFVIFSGRVGIWLRLPLVFTPVNLSMIYDAKRKCGWEAQWTYIYRFMLIYDSCWQWKFYDPLLALCSKGERGGNCKAKLQVYGGWDLEVVCKYIVLWYNLLQLNWYVVFYVTMAATWLREL